MEKDEKTFCEDCGIETTGSYHTGCERWCEDCFDKGLCKDMDDHFKDFIKKELELQEK